MLIIFTPLGRSIYSSMQPRATVDSMDMAVYISLRFKCCVGTVYPYNIERGRDTYRKDRRKQKEEDEES